MTKKGIASYPVMDENLGKSQKKEIQYEQL